jgi:type III secretion inner rod protein HrpB2
MAGRSATENEMNPMMSSVQLQASLTQEFSGNPAQVSQQLADKFQSMVAHSTPHRPDDSAHAPTIVTKAITDQDAAYAQVPNDMVYLMENGPMMSMDQITNASMFITLEMASMTTNLQVKMAVVTSSKDAVQTLMKNQ